MHVALMQSRTRAYTRSERGYRRLLGAAEKSSTRVVSPRCERLSFFFLFPTGRPSPPARCPFSSRQDTVHASDLSHLRCPSAQLRTMGHRALCVGVWSLHERNRGRFGDFWKSGHLGANTCVIFVKISAAVARPGRLAALDFARRNALATEITLASSAAFSQP